MIFDVHSRTAKNVGVVLKLGRAVGTATSVLRAYTRASEIRFQDGNTPHTAGT